MNLVQSTGWHRGAGPHTRTGPTSTPRTPHSTLLTMAKQPGPVQTHNTQPLSRTFKSKILEQSSPTHAYTHWFFQVVFKESKQWQRAQPYRSPPRHLTEQEGKAEQDKTYRLNVAGMNTPGKQQSNSAKNIRQGPLPQTQAQPGCL